MIPWSSDLLLFNESSDFSVGNKILQSSNNKHRLLLDVKSGQ